MLGKLPIWVQTSLPTEEIFGLGNIFIVGCMSNGIIFN
jgi:hypothetical protein